MTTDIDQIKQDILNFLKSPERKDFAIKSTKEAHEASENILKELEVKNDRRIWTNKNRKNSL